jgi:CRP/FNR family transcriptional regulator, dissimilatory nitrate respiration regulator
MNEYTRVLAFSPLFKNMTVEEIARLLSGIHLQIRHFKCDEVVVCGGDVCSSLQMVVVGSVRGEMMDTTGRVLKIEDIGVPRPLAAAFLFGQNNYYPVTITANEDSTLLVLPRESVIKLIQTNENFLTNFMNVISNRAQFITDKLKVHSFQSLKGKLADYLIGLDLKGDGIICLTLTQAQLADQFGVARPSLSRAMREMHHDGLIDAIGKHIRILDRERLKAWVGR